MTKNNFEIGDILYQSLLDYYDNKAYRVKDIIITNSYVSKKYTGEFVKIYVLDSRIPDFEKVDTAYKFTLDSNFNFDYCTINNTINNKVFMPSENLYGKILNLIIVTKTDITSGTRIENKPTYELGYKVIGLNKEYYYLSLSDIVMIEKENEKEKENTTKIKINVQDNNKKNKLINDTLFLSVPYYEKIYKQNVINDNECEYFCESRMFYKLKNDVIDSKKILYDIYNVLKKIERKM